GHKGVAIDEEHLLIGDGLLADWQRQIHTPVQQHLKQQVFRSAIFANTVDLAGQEVLVDSIGGVVNILHVGGTNFECSEANINALTNAPSILSNRRTSLTNSLTRNFRNGLISCLRSFRLGIRYLVKLNHDEPPVSAILCIGLQDCMRSSS